VVWYIKITTYRDLKVAGILDSENRIIPSFDDPYTLRTDNELEDESKHEYSLDYRKKYKEKGRSLSGRLSFQDNGETEQSILTNQLYQSGISLENITKEQRSRNDENETRTLAQIDYKHPIGKDTKIEIGGQTSIRTIKDFGISIHFSHSQMSVTSSLVILISIQSTLTATKHNTSKSGIAET